MADYPRRLCHPTAPLAHRVRSHGETSVSEEIAVNDDDMTPAPSIGEVTMDAYFADMRDDLAQAEADGLVDITPTSAPK